MSWLWVPIRPGGPRLALVYPSRAQSSEQLQPAQWLSSQPGLGKALFTLEGSTAFVTVTHCCWEPKNTFINGKIGLAPQSNILPSVEELAEGSQCILGKYGFLSSRGPKGGSMLPSRVPAQYGLPTVTVSWARLQRRGSAQHSGPSLCLTR